jgi:hypothetical protein
MSTVDARAQKWLDSLAASDAELKLITYDKRFASHAVWLGDPFIVIGDSRNLDAYLTTLDHEELEILNDCAYFWLLTENEGFTHPKLPTDRLIAFELAHLRTECCSRGAAAARGFSSVKGIGQAHALHKRGD